MNLLQTLEEEQRQKLLAARGVPILTRVTLRLSCRAIVSHRSVHLCLLVLGARR